MKIKITPDYEHYKVIARIRLQMVQLVDPGKQKETRKEILVWYKGKCKDLKETCSQFYMEVK